MSQERQIFIEKTEVKSLLCYKEKRYAGTSEAACPWGYTSIQPNCKHCRWLSMTAVVREGKPLIVDRPIPLLEMVNWKAGELGDNITIIDGPMEGIGG